MTAAAAAEWGPEDNPGLGSTVRGSQQLLPPTPRHTAGNRLQHPPSSRLQPPPSHIRWPQATLPLRQATDVALPPLSSSSQGHSRKVQRKQRAPAAAAAATRAPAATAAAAAAPAGPTGAAAATADLRALAALLLRKRPKASAQACTTADQAVSGEPSNKRPRRAAAAAATLKLQQQAASRSSSSGNSSSDSDSDSGSNGSFRCSSEYDGNHGSGSSSSGDCTDMDSANSSGLTPQQRLKLKGDDDPNWGRLQPFPPDSVLCPSLELQSAGVAAATPALTTGSGQLRQDTQEGQYCQDVEDLSVYREGDCLGRHIKLVRKVSPSRTHMGRLEHVEFAFFRHGGETNLQLDSAGKAEVATARSTCVSLSGGCRHHCDMSNIWVWDSCFGTHIATPERYFTHLLAVTYFTLAVPH